MNLLSTLVVFLSTLRHSSAGFGCSGMGRRWCDVAAPQEDDCPTTCQKKYCSTRRPYKIISNGVSKYKSTTWDEVVDTGLYEHVYIDSNYLCVGVCWYKPWEAKCEDWKTYSGKKYCAHLNCEHDKGSSANSGNRFAGCHRDEDGNRKKPFHRPTCKECARIFPKACGSVYSGDDDDDSSEDDSSKDDSSKDESSDAKDSAADDDSSEDAKDDAKEDDDSSDSTVPDGDSSDKDSEKDSEDDEDSDVSSEYLFDQCKDNCKRKNKSDGRIKQCIKDKCRKSLSVAAAGSGYIQTAEELEAELERKTATESFVPFEYAPESWKILFVDEVDQQDPLVVSVVNVIFQFANSLDDLDQRILEESMAVMAGVHANQVMLMHTFDNTERYALNALNDTANITDVEWVTDHLLTVSVGVVTPNPEETAADIRRITNDAWKRRYKDAADMKFLERSLTAEVKHISSSMLNPRAIQHAKMLPASVVAGSLITMEEEEEVVIEKSANISKTTIIVGILAGVLALLAAAMGAVLIFRKVSTQPPSEVPFFSAA